MRFFLILLVCLLTVTFAIAEEQYAETEDIFTEEIIFEEEPILLGGETFIKYADVREPAFLTEEEEEYFEQEDDIEEPSYFLRDVVVVKTEDRIPDLLYYLIGFVTLFIVAMVVFAKLKKPTVAKNITEEARILMQRGYQFQTIKDYLVRRGYGEKDVDTILRGLYK